jgi:hypothetical protein
LHYPTVQTLALPVDLRIVRARAREVRRLFCPLEKGGRNHAEPFFVPDMAMKPHKPVPGTGAADFACPPLQVLATAWPAPICVTAANLRTQGGSFRAQSVYGAARRGGFVCARICNGVRWRGVRRSADLSARGRDPSMPSNRGRNHRHGSRVGEEKGDLESTIGQ